MAERVIADRGKQKWIVISVAFATFMSCLDNYIVNISLPTIAKYFNVSPGIVSWILIAYLLAVTSSMLIFGKLSDNIGLKKIFISGYFFFILGSFLCGISPNINILIISRCIQGLGGAMMYTTAFAIISKFLPKDVTGWAFGILSTVAAFGIAIGAPLGGFITGFFSWHWIFLVNVPVGIIAIIIAFKVIPLDKFEHAGEEEKKEELFDIFGAVLSFTGLVALLYALNRGQAKGWDSPVILSCFAAAAILLFIFVLWEKKHPDPILDLKLFRNLDFTFGNLAALAAFILMSGNNFVIPFYLELIKGLKVEQAGMVLMLFSFIYMAAGPVFGRLSDKIDPRILCGAGMFSSACACFIFIFTLKLNGITGTIVFLAWLALSYGAFISPNNNQVMSLAVEGKQGIASSIFRTMSNLGLILGVCLFEIIFTQSLPANTIKAGVSLHNAKIPASVLLSGFGNVYVFGGIVCVIACVFSMFAKAGKQKAGDESAIII